MNRIQIEKHFGKCSKARAAQLAQRIELGKRILARIESDRIIHYDRQVLINAVDNCLSGEGMTRKQHAAWGRYANLVT